MTAINAAAPATKTVDQHFVDWESGAFGFGYGTGEQHVLPALRRFMELVPAEGHYDYEALERGLTPTVAWLLINVLCREDILEYGTSPRYAWLTEAGRALRDYVLSMTPDQLVEIVTHHQDDEAPICYRDACNCGPMGYVKGRECPNPFWGR